MATDNALEQKPPIYYLQVRTINTEEIFWARLCVRVYIFTLRALCAPKTAVIDKWPMSSPTKPKKGNLSVSYPHCETLLHSETRLALIFCCLFSFPFLFYHRLHKLITLFVILGGVSVCATTNKSNFRLYFGTVLLATPIIQKFIDTDCTVVGCYRCHCCRMFSFRLRQLGEHSLSFSIFGRRCASVQTAIAKQNVPHTKLIYFRLST